MAADDCPSRELLLAYHTGDLPEDSADEVIAHLSRCAACQAVLKTFGESEDSLLARLRRPEAELHGAEPQCRELLDRVSSCGMLSVTCQCGKRFQLDAKYGGRRVKCRACGAIMVVREAAPEPPMALPPGLNGAETQTNPPESPGSPNQPADRDVEIAQGFSVARGEEARGSAGDRGPYVLIRPLATGGMGRVSIARDEPLKREVALKELLNVASSNDLSRRRFIEEAEITGQLEHPGVVPVYALGIDRDGMPFYAMRLVRGRTLKKAIAQHHGSYSGAGLRELLRRFVSICQTVAYAHARGVVHRDLKPSNIMLGEYGETLVMDWGLAKPVPPSGHQDSTVGDLVEKLADRPEFTLPGGLVGTPAYMSPEQASGTSGPVAPTVDVYCLGTVLYEILCGRAAYSGGSSTEIIEKVRSSPPQRPSLVEVRTPRPLEAVCLKAMAREPGQRYASARALAAEVQNWLDDEPVAAYREPILERLYRWTRKHKALAASIAVFSMALVLTIAFGSVIVAREQAKTLAAQQLAEDYARQAAEAEQKARERELKAEQLTEEANKARQEASEAIRKVTLSEKAAAQAGETIARLENDLKSKSEEAQQINQQLAQARTELASAEAAAKLERQRAAAAADRVKTLERDIKALQAEVRELRALSASLAQLATGAPPKEAAERPEASQSPSLEGDFTEQPVDAFDVAAEDRASCVLTADTAKVSVGRQSIRLETLSTSDVCITYPKSRNANWDLSRTMTLSMVCHLEDPSITFRQEGVRVRLGRGSYYLECRARPDILQSAQGSWALFIIPFNGNDTWTRSDVNGLDISHVDWIEIHLGAEKPGMTFWLDALGFEAPRAIARFDDEDGFVSLFDGKTLNGWQGQTEHHSVEDGNLVSDYGPGPFNKTGQELYTTKEYGDFILRFDYKLSRGANSGVLLRAPICEKPWEEALEVQILDDTAPAYRGLAAARFNGSLYALVPAKQGHLNPPGEWNGMEVLCQGQQVKVVLNGAVILDTNLGDPSDKAPAGRNHPGLSRSKGHLGLQANGSQARTEYRNIRVKDLTHAQVP